MNTQEQVTRLEALLTRIQYNAQALHRERSEGGTSGSVDSPVTVTTADAPVMQAVPVTSHPPPALSLSPDSSVLLEAELESIPPAENLEDTYEQTKPLWVGLNQPSAPSTPPSLGYSVRVPPTSEAAGHVAGDTLEPQRSPDALDPSESSPPLSGERASTRSPSLIPLEEPLSLEEPLHSIPAPGVANEREFAPEPSLPLASAGQLETDADFAQDRESRISDAPASVLGATITLPEAESEDMELELAEPPPSSRRVQTPPFSEARAEDELEADLPRTSYRAAYDDSLSAPPKAKEELAARDLSVLERVSSLPTPAVSTPAPEEPDLPPVLSSRPRAPVTIPPQSFVSPTAPDDARSSSQVDLSSPLLPAVEYAPEHGVLAASFEGAPPRPQLTSFLTLLDVSLSLEVTS